MTARSRFYREVSVDSPSLMEWGYRVLLDGKPIRTPAGSLLLLPKPALAEAIAEEWRVQSEKLRPETMILTKLANMAADQVTPNRATAVAQIIAFARSDLLCYRAETPGSLVERQTAAWDPLLDWARTRYGTALVAGTGINFVEQPAAALTALERAVTEHDAFVLAGLHAATALLGSAIIALALLENRLTAEQAFTAAQLDEIYQAERWGQDSEAQNLAIRKSEELSDVARYFTIVRG